MWDRFDDAQRREFAERIAASPLTEIIVTDTIPESNWVSGIPIFPGSVTEVYGLAVLAVIAGLAFSVLLNRTRFGFDLKASGLSPSAAGASGVDARAMVTGAFQYTNDLEPVPGALRAMTRRPPTIRGRVVDASARKNEDFLFAMLDQDPGARNLGEIAVGTNYAIKNFSRNTLFDEKIGGTMHFALGKSYPETGGRNESALHWDLVCDLRSGSEVHADGELVYRDGRFLDGLF